MEDDELERLAKENLELQATILIADMELEMTAGINEENREEYYQKMLDEWESPHFLKSLTKEMLERCFQHIAESLMLLDWAKRDGIDISNIPCLDEKYREQ